MKERKAGVAMGGWDWAPTPPETAVVVDWGFEMGSVGGDAISPPVVVVEKYYKPRKKGKIEIG